MNFKVAGRKECKVIMKKILIILLSVIICNSICTEIHAQEDNIEKIEFVEKFLDEKAFIFDKNGEEVTNYVKNHIAINFISVDEIYDYLILNNYSSICPANNEIEGINSLMPRTTLLATNGFYWTDTFYGVATSVFVGANITWDSNTRKIISRSAAIATLKNGSPDMSAGIEQPNSQVTVNAGIPQSVSYIPRVYIKKSGAYLYLKQKIMFTIVCTMNKQPQPVYVGEW